MKNITPKTTAIFGRIFQPKSRREIFGKDQNGYYSFIGGKRNKGEIDLMGQTFEREAGQEANATANPTNFGDPRYNLHLVLAHYKPFMCLLDNYHRLIQPWDDFIGDAHLKIVVPMLEVSGNTPYDCTELTNLGFYDYTELKNSGANFRTLVGLTRKAKRTDWIGLELPKPGKPYTLSVAYMRHNSGTKLNLSPAFINERFPEALCTKSVLPPQVAAYQAHA